MGDTEISIWKFLFGHEKDEKKKSIDSTKSVGPELIDSVEEDNAITNKIECTSDKVEAKKRFRKKTCRHFSVEARRVLKDSYQKNTYLSDNELKRITSLVDLSEKQVRKWFNNARRADNNKSKKRKYIRFTSETTEILENYFQKNQHPSSSERKKLMKVTGLTNKRIKTWFSCNLYRRKSRFNDEQERQMIGALSKNGIVSANKILKLATEFNTNVKYVELWYSNRRNNKSMIKD